MLEIYSSFETLGHGSEVTLKKRYGKILKSVSKFECCIFRNKAKCFCQQFMEILLTFLQSTVEQQTIMLERRMFYGFNPSIRLLEQTNMLRI